MSMYTGAAKRDRQISSKAASRALPVRQPPPLEYPAVSIKKTFVGHHDTAVIGSSEDESDESGADTNDNGGDEFKFDDDLLNVAMVGDVSFMNSTTSSVATKKKSKQKKKSSTKRKRKKRKDSIQSDSG